MDLILASKMLTLSIPIVIIIAGICWFIYEL